MSMALQNRSFISVTPDLVTRTTQKAKAREQFLNMCSYEKKMSGKNKKKSRYSKPSKPKKSTLVTRFRKQPKRSIIIDFIFLLGGLLALVLLVYYWLS